MKNSLFLLLSITLISLVKSCEKEKVVEVKYVEIDKSYSWKELAFDKGFDRIYYNLSVDSNQLYAQIPFMIKVIKGPDSRRAFYLSDINNDYFFQKVPMTDFLHAHVYNKTSVFVKKINGSSSIDGAVIDVKAFDSTAKEVHNYTSMEFNQNKNLLLEYWGADYSNYTLLLVKYDNIMFGNQPSLKLKEVKRINLPNTYSSSFKDGIKQIKSIDDFYIVITRSGMYKVLLDGTYIKVNEHLFDKNNARCIKMHNAIYVFDYDVTLVSTDNGIRSLNILVTTITYLLQLF